MFDLVPENTGSEELWASGGHMTNGDHSIIAHSQPQPWESALPPSVLALVYQLAICPPVSPLYTANWVFDLLYKNICFNSGLEFVFKLLPPVVHQRSWTLSYWDYPARLSELTMKGFIVLQSPSTSNIQILQVVKSEQLHIVFRAWDWVCSIRNFWILMQ